MTDWPPCAGEMAERIRTFDWAVTPLGSIATWSDRLKLMIEQVLACPLVSTLSCGREGILVYNDAAIQLYGDHHPTALGRPLRQTFPEGWATVAPFYERAFAGETVQVAGQPLDTRGEGVETEIFDALLMPVREADGRVAYVHMTGIELGDRARSAALLRASEARYRHLFDAIDEGFCTIEVLFDSAGDPADYRFLSVNAAFTQQTGLTDPIGRTMRELSPEHEAHWFETYGRIARNGQPERFEDRAEALGRWYDVYAFRVGAPEQRQVGILFKDILARKRAEERVHESEERFRAFVTASSDVIYRMSPDWSEMRQLDGRGFLSDTASPSEAWLGAYIDPEDQPRVTAAIQSAIRSKVTFELEHRVRRADGSLGWTYSRAVPLLNKTGEIREWFGTASDVTVRRDAEEALRQSEARFRTLADTAPALIWRNNEKGENVFINQYFINFTGKSADMIRGEGWHSIVHPDDVEDYVADYLAAVRDRRAWQNRNRIRRHDGQWRWFENYAQPLFGNDGSYLGHVGVSTDTTASIVAEIALRKSEERFQHVVRATRDIVWDIDLVTERVWWSEALQTELGFSADEIGPDMAWCFDHMHSDDRERVIAGMKEAADGTDHFWSDEFRYRRGDGRYAHIEDRGFITRDPSGRALRMTGAMREVTAQHEAEAALRASFERQGFLLRFSDALRAESGTDAVANRAIQMLADELQVDRCYITYYRPADDAADFPYQVGNDTVPPLPAKVRLSDFPDAYEQVLDKTFVIEDDFERRGLSETERASSKALGMRAMVASTVRRGEQNPLCSMAVVSSRPRQWSFSEIALVEDAAERTWAAVERARVEASLRKSEERYRALVTAGAYMLYRMSPDWRQMLQLSGRDMLVDTLDTVENWADTYHFPEDQPVIFAVIQKAIETKSLFELEHRVRGRDGGIGWVLSRAVPLLGDDGEITEWFGVASDVTARHEAQARLRESEEQLRQFGEASSDVLWIRDAESLQWIYLTPAFEAIYGLDRKAALAGDNMTGWLDLIVPEDRQIALDAIQRVRAGERAAFEYRVQRPDDAAVRWVRNTDFPMRDATGRLCWIGGVGRDITEEKETAERMEVLVAELQHRTRNLLGVVRALFQETIKRSGSLSTFNEQFGERLAALARVNALLSRSGQPRIAIGELVRISLDALGGSTMGERIRLAGPEVRLRSSVVQTLALALHELATNARKYGALAAEQGRLEVVWSTYQPDGEGSRLVVEWTEHGRAVIQDKAEPSHRGYGRELIERALPYALKARTHYELGEDGVRCSLDLPLTRAPRRERPSS